ncbi:MFS transporter [Leptodontidium sp. MPI-SDFR-AT-0119]|nr:MFS transporter [Leptodontidium sp. MPI-SDFR-AT-0119]
MADIEKRAAPAPDSGISPDYGNRDSTEIPSKANFADIGYDLFQQSQQYDTTQLEIDSVKVRRKLDFIVLPMMMTTYMLSFLDKQTLNYSNAYGLQPDTHMTGDDYSWVSSALYFGWLIGAYPSNLALQRFPIGKMIGTMLFVWGSICMLQAAVFNFSGFFAIRFSLGFVEACISPAWILLTSMLWTREEQPLRTSFWLSVNGMSSIIGALLSYGLRHVDGLAIPNWKLIYVVVGTTTIAWGFVIILYLPDGPHNAKCLTEYERIVAVWRVSKNQTGIKEALLDSKTYLLLLMAACYGILNGGVANFISSIIKGFGYSPLKTSLLQTPGGAFEIVMCIAFGYLSTYKNTLGLTIIPRLVGLLKIPIAYRYALVGCSGHTKRSTVLGLYFIVYCSGNIAGPHIFIPPQAPRYFGAIKGLLVAYCIDAGLQVAYTAVCYMENKRREKAGLVADAEVEALEGFGDLTDKENVHFRYRI